jgi:hypothetical protein
MFLDLLYFEGFCLFSLYISIREDGLKLGIVFQVFLFEGRLSFLDFALLSFEVWLGLMEGSSSFFSFLKFGLDGFECNGWGKGSCFLFHSLSKSSLFISIGWRGAFHLDFECDGIGSLFFFD